MEWTFPVTPGQYEVRLYFAEIYSGAWTVGKRRFDVLVEGSLVLDDYDVFAAAGANRGIMRAFTVTSDSALDVDFRQVAENPALKAIEIVAAGTPPGPAAVRHGEVAARRRDGRLGRHGHVRHLQRGDGPGLDLRRNLHARARLGAGEPRACDRHLRRCPEARHARPLGGPRGGRHVRRDREGPARPV